MTTHTTTNTSTPTSTTAPPTTPARRRPSTAGYWLGALLAVLTTLGALTWGAFTFLGWQSHVEDFTRLTPPGTAAVSVTDTGTRFLYLEHDRSTPVPSIPAITVTGPSGTQVPLTAYDAEMRYDVPNVANRIGDAVLTFQTDEPGTYQVTIADTDPGTTLAVGDNLVRGWGPQVLGSVALLLGGLLLALILAIITAARRSRSTT